MAVSGSKKSKLTVRTYGGKKNAAHIDGRPRTPASGTVNLPRGR